MKQLAKFYNWILRRRYQMHISGVELLEGSGSRLYLPNHQGSIDPQIVMSIILQYHKAAPMMSQSYYNIPGIKQFMNNLQAVPIADFDQGARDASVMDRIRKSAKFAFDKGHSILLYPSGQLANQGYEKIFNKQSAYALVNEAPDTTAIIGVRMHGLWGSIWSKAWNGRSPSFLITYFWSILLMLINLFLFLPKRKVNIEFVDITTEAKSKAAKCNRREFNVYLESFYNVYGEEYLRYIPHHFLFSKVNRSIPKSIHATLSSQVSIISFRHIVEESSI